MKTNRGKTAVASAEPEATRIGWSVVVRVRRENHVEAPIQAGFGLPQYPFRCTPVLKACNDELKVLGVMRTEVMDRGFADVRGVSLAISSSRFRANELASFRTQDTPISRCQQDPVSSDFH
jgi:hypothetical protein